MKMRVWLQRSLVSGALIAMVAGAAAGCGGARPGSTEVDVRGAAKTGAPVSTTPAAGSNPNQSVAAPVNPSQPVSKSPSQPAAPSQPSTGPSQGQQGAASPSNPGTGTPTEGQKGASAPAQPAAPAPVHLTASTVARGAYSAITEKGAFLFTDSAAWQAHWQRHAANQVPTPAAPAVDFSKESVLAVYMGEQNTGGYSVEITDATLADSRVEVRVRQTRPGPGAITTQALTQPFHIVRVPKVPSGAKLEVAWQ